MSDNKQVTITKSRLIQYMSDEITAIAENYSESDTMARINRFKGQAEMLRCVEALDDSELMPLYEQLQIARAQAEKNIYNKK